MSSSVFCKYFPPTISMMRVCDYIVYIVYIVLTQTYYGMDTGDQLFAHSQIDRIRV